MIITLITDISGFVSAILTSPTEFSAYLKLPEDFA